MALNILAASFRLISLFLSPSSHRTNAPIITYHTSGFFIFVRKPTTTLPAANENEQIPKPSTEEGLTIGWPQQKTDMDKLKALSEEIKSKM